MLYIKENGQTLIEVIVAIVLCALVLVGVTKMIASSYTNVDFSQNQVNASSYAQEGMTYMNNLHATDLATFQSDVNNTNSIGTSGVNGITYCLDSTPALTATTTCLSPLHPNITIGSGYIRSAILQSGGSCSGTQVTVTVQWNDKDCPSSNYCHNSKLVSCYSNANVAPTL